MLKASLPDSTLLPAWKFAQAETKPITTNKSHGYPFIAASLQHEYPLPKRNLVLSYMRLFTWLPAHTVQLVSWQLETNLSRGYPGRECLRRTRFRLLRCE